MLPTIQRHWQELEQRYPLWHTSHEAFVRAVHLLLDCVSTGHKILICGNGGSAADAEHIAAELMKSFLVPRPMPEEFLARARRLFPQEAAELANLQQGIAIIPLVAGVALPTAFANDVNWQLGFAQQVNVLARTGDVVWGISTSGNSVNVNHALRVARLLDCKTLGLTGKDGGQMSGLLDVELRAPSPCTPHVQELHLPMYHALCACLEEILFGGHAARNTRPD